MTGFNTNTILIIVVVIVVIIAIFYLNKNDDQPIHNNGTIKSMIHDSHRLSNKMINSEHSPSLLKRPTNPPPLNNRMRDDFDGNYVDELVASYDTANTPFDDKIGTFSPSDPMAEQHGIFDNYGTKKQLKMRDIDMPYYDDEYDNRDFSYKKKRFTKRTPDDIKDQFDVTKMLPQELEDWFDITPLQDTKKIRGTHLIHPKVHMGVNTVGNSLKNGTHDLRGDVPNPKFYVSPFLNSTIEPDTNIKGICNAI